VWRGHAARPAVLVAVLFALVTHAPAAATAAPSPAAPAPSAAADPVKYYVVAERADGRREFLFDIAARTLGDGNRFPEIFALNEGRPQPDGQRLVDPTVLNAGWYLLLPSDASGPDVREGALPAFAPAPSPPPADAGGGRAGVVAALAGAAAVLLVGAALALRRRSRRADPRATPPPRAAPPPPAAPAAPPAPRAPAPATPRADVEESAGLPAPVLKATVTDGPDVIAVRLAGARGGVRLPHTWTVAGDPHLATPGTVALGLRDGATLHVDLALSPDVVTVSGPAAGRRRLVRSMIRQLLDGGATVAVVGEVAGAHPPDGVTAVPSFDQLPADPGSQLRVVFGSLSGGGDLPAVRRLASEPHPRTVLVIADNVRRARWSVQVRPASGEPHAREADAGATR